MSNWSLSSIDAKRKAEDSQHQQPNSELNRKASQEKEVGQ
jgi:hypothetical protein